MPQFAKLFVVDGYQVLSFKDYDAENCPDGAPYQIMSVTDFQTFRPNIINWYKSEEKRDIAFVSIDQDFAEKLFENVFWPLKEKYEDDGKITEIKENLK